MTMDRSTSDGSVPTSDRDSLPHAEAEARLDAMLNEYLGMRSASLLESKRFYFMKLMPLLRPIYEANEQHRKLREHGTDVLISLMGMSPETTVTAAIVLRPKRLIVIRSEGDEGENDVDETANLALEYLQTSGITRPITFRAEVVDAFDPVDIFRKIEGHLNLSARCVIDITGGTKVMSATAGYFGFAHNVPLFYINGGWNPRAGAADARKVKAGFIPSPRAILGRQFRESGRQMYSTGNYARAAEEFDLAYNHHHDNAPDKLSEALARCYAEAFELRQTALEDRVSRLEKLQQEENIRRIVPARWDISGHIAALRRAASPSDDSLAGIAVLNEVSSRYMRLERFDLAMLYAYRCLEHVIFFGLRERYPGFDVSRPNYEQLNSDQDVLQEKLAEFFGRNDQRLPDAVGLVDGFALLCACDDLTTDLVEVGAQWARDPRNAIQRVMGVARLRNESVIGHGWQTPSLRDVTDFNATADLIARAVLGAKYGELAALLAQLAPRDLALLYQ